MRHRKARLAEPRSELDIYCTLRDRRASAYRKDDDVADQGFLRKRRQVWDGMMNQKGLRWKGGDHLLVAISKTGAGAEILPLSELRALDLPQAGGSFRLGGPCPSLHDGSIAKMLGGELGMAVATCIHIRNGVLSVEFLDGDVFGGIPVRSCDNHCYVALAVNASADVRRRTMAG